MAHRDMIGAPANTVKGYDRMSGPLPTEATRCLKEAVRLCLDQLAADTLARLEADMRQTLLDITTSIIRQAEEEEENEKK